MNLFLKRYRQHGHDFDPAALVLKRALRVNTNKIDEETLVKRLIRKKIKLEKIPFLNSGYFYESDFSLGATPEYLLGYYYLQEASSQIPAIVLGSDKDDVVLDMCAAPGSKTTQLSEIMRGNGCIVAVDNHSPRINSLRNNIERLGCKNIVVVSKDANYIRDLGMTFDKILLDAPCSGNFMTDKSWFDRRKLHDFVEMQQEQKKLLRAAVGVLKDDGVLVYSTCTLEIEENEEVVEFALSLGLKLEPIDMGVGEPGLTVKTKECRRIWPESGMQPFFIAKFRKTV